MLSANLNILGFLNSKQAFLLFFLCVIDTKQKKGMCF